MPEQSSAYRSFRSTAYRKKYDIALYFGLRPFSFGDLLSRSEYAYNSFRQMGIEKGDRVLLWLPDCPDLLAAFYGLSRLGAVAVLSHPAGMPCEVQNQLEATGSKLLMTTSFRYRRYLEQAGAFPESRLILCRPERDMKRADRKVFLAEEPPFPAEAYDFEALLKTNRYNANETPAGEAEPGVILFGGSSVLRCTPAAYSTEELERAGAEFYGNVPAWETVFVENAFASEGGFLAVHTALCRGKTLLWSVGDPLPLLKKKRPDYLAATEEFFWELRQNVDTFRQWTNLSGGLQIGKPLTPLMRKFAAKAFARMGGGGALEEAPVSFKTQAEELYQVKDYGLYLADAEAVLSALPGIAACRCEIGEEGLRLRLQPDGTVNAAQLVGAVLAFCREELRPGLTPEKVEFTAVI